ncbi:hypothetical protein [Mesomycoplasma conjunctivae]|uniref:hypothetical protein n=1 Tax=Mesomycoplasma conjunctivae TaxID=45361 RepID=UPI003DA49D82
MKKPVTKLSLFIITILSSVIASTIFIAIIATIIYFLVFKRIGSFEDIKKNIQIISEGLNDFDITKIKGAFEKISQIDINKLQSSLDNLTPAKIQEIQDILSKILKIVEEQKSTIASIKV